MNTVSLSLLFGALLYVDASIMERPIVPFTDPEKAAAYATAFAEAHSSTSEEASSTVQWEDRFGHIFAQTYTAVMHPVGSQSTADQVTLNLQQVKDRVAYMRMHMESVTCSCSIGDGQQFDPPSYTLELHCSFVASLKNSQDIDEWTEDITETFNDDGYLVRSDIVSAGDWHGLLPPAPAVQRVSGIPAQAGRGTPYVVHHHHHGQPVTWRELAVIGGTALGLYALYKK
eukprot:CAMPEP_0197022814 /NCGR_PEP_ID=MMETSP1384-20130603/3615_1 /TAXON_ID=29189 /ORGANISM="Ammonia sp." /LENGTH=228 /DNA_ID=CAMNT_0042450921 /DNA_START=54 /DNA_END=740 /DNA_ORIENTATION=+